MELFLCLVAMLGKLHDWSFIFKNILKLILFFPLPAYLSFQKPRWKFLNCEYFSFEETNLPSLHLPNAHEGDRTCLKVFDYDKGPSFDWSQGWGGNATNLPAAPGSLHFISGGVNSTCRKLLQVRVPLWAEGQRKILQVGKRNSRNFRTFYIKLAREIIRQLKSIFLRNRELSNVWSDFFYNDDFTSQVPTRPAVLQWDFVDLLWTRRQACRVSGGGWRGGLQGNIPWVSLHSIPSHQAKKDF